MANLAYIVLLFMLAASGSLYLRNPSSQQVYMVSVNGTYAKLMWGSTTYMEVVNQVLDYGRSAPDALIYSYKESFTGFSARLTDKERKRLEGVSGILGVRPSENYELYTTRSWDFLKFPFNVHREAAESDLIIGVIDTGIWPDSLSFSGIDFPPPPARWSGVCETISCNNKIIGARAYYTGIDPLVEDLSVLDTSGHGTHVASTAAGRIVQDASFFNLGKGMARGGVPSARIAVYKVCWTTTKGATCPEQDIFKAIDDAMSDGVDIIQASLGRRSTEYRQDGLAVGSFRAMKKGILTVAAAGNAGPGFSTLSNGAPWILTVAATTLDRKFMVDLELGNQQAFRGENINSVTDQQFLYKLVIAQNLRNGSSMANTENVNVVTEFTEKKVNEAIEINPRGVIAIGDDCPKSSPSFPLPGVCLTSLDGEHIVRYLNAGGEPTGKIYEGYATHDPSAPVVAQFSSRGPNPTSAGILKPDISAPGYNILAAWPPNVKPSSYANDRRSSAFNIISGTSMACPHVSAIAVYIKSFHPTWSPSAIKSAIMTTATAMRRDANAEFEFAYGSGQLNAIQALEPGLVYEATETDYLKFLCAEEYSDDDIKIITGDGTASCAGTVGFTTNDLNYPSISAKVVSDLAFVLTFPRTVTHVESRKSVYTANVIIHTPGVAQVEVDPRTLSFSYEGQKRDFVVRVYGKGFGPNAGVFATLIWTDGRREVRSPIVVYTGTW